MGVLGTRPDGRRRASAYRVHDGKAICLNTTPIYMFLFTAVSSLYITDEIWQILVTRYILNSILFLTDIRLLIYI